MTERELTAGLKQGDNEARKRLYELFAGPMLALCYRYTGQREEAEDLMHDCFLHVFRTIGKFTFREDGSLGRWMRRVFTNYTLSYMDKRAVTYTGEVENLPDIPDEDLPPDDIPTEVIMQYIAELPPGYRTVLNLYLVEGWSHADIARKLHIGESTSASQYLRAKKLLKEKLSHYLQSDES